MANADSEGQRGILRGWRQKRSLIEGDMPIGAFAIGGDSPFTAGVLQAASVEKKEFSTRARTMVAQFSWVQSAGLQASVHASTARLIHRRALQPRVLLRCGARLMHPCFLNISIGTWIDVDMDACNASDSGLWCCVNP